MNKGGTLHLMQLESWQLWDFSDLLLRLVWTFYPLRDWTLEPVGLEFKFDSCLIGAILSKRLNVNFRAEMKVKIISVCQRMMKKTKEDVWKAPMYSISCDYSPALFAELQGLNKTGRCETGNVRLRGGPWQQVSFRHCFLSPACSLWKNNCSQWQCTPSLYWKSIGK